MQDGTITIATGSSSRSKSWKNKQILWSELVDTLSISTTTRETLKEFIQASKEDQHRIKDVGGYVGGYLRGGKRSPENVVHRQLLTLDVDFANSDFFEDYKLQFDNAAIVHGTHKHSALEPRFRLVIPLDRECSSDEYVAIGRKVAGTLGIDRFDNTTFEPNRLMFWPSNPVDVPYYFEEQVGEFMCADDILASYLDWKDTSLWPTADKKLREIGDAAKKQEDPIFKRGIVGAFCRTYSITEAIETFLSEQYIPSTEGRFTFTGGSTASGLIIYDDTFAYSHHGTDPAGGKLCNAFDLVRVHKYGHLDANEKSNKSFIAMEEFAMSDSEVRKIIAREKIAEAKEVYADFDEISAPEDFDWMEALEIDSKGKYLSTASNIDLIIQNDKYLKDAFKHNEFDGKRYVDGRKMPWRKVDQTEPMRNVDYSGVRNYIERVYGISSQLKVDDSLAIEVERNSFHPIRDYLNTVSWDGQGRVDTLLIDYFGAEDTLYTREAMRKMLVGAVARVMHPGVKFDLVLTLVGEQGLKKSSFFKVLGKDWFSDTFMTVHGKEALEQIQGAWIIEIAELAGLKKADIEATKHFLTKQQDQFRPAYARVSEKFDRQCVFFATTNSMEFLRDPSGNRRFLPVLIHNQLSEKDLKELSSELDNIWAEAVHLYKAGEKIYLSEEAEGMARLKQAAHSESDERTGLIQQYLERKLPKKWGELKLHERRAFLDLEAQGEEERKFVCVAEIWTECLGKNLEDMTRYSTKDVNDILRGMPNLRPHLSTKNFSFYGKQRYYEINQKKE